MRQRYVTYKANIEVGKGLECKVSCLHAENNDVELIGELILYCLPPRPLD